ncbi:MAG: DNA internalization-related competence protein ComEC/Rec2 [Clostridia bacterium]|nr:DNA internalization-related competence protein ComEC/Rec2 [Clostridia bacterium]
MLLLGNLRAGAVLSVKDMPTMPGAWIEGRIEEVLKPYRVRLTDVSVDGKNMDYAHDVVVTLMTDEEGELPAHPFVGQFVAGRGRLFSPEEKRNPGGVDRRIQALCDGYELSGYLLNGWKAEGTAVFSFAESFRLLRNRILARVERLFGEDAALFQGIMLGDRSALDADVTAAMRLTGIAHILTVSGLHMGMIAQVLSLLLDRLPVRRRTRFALLGVILSCFSCLTGAAAGTVRALIMALLREYAVLRGRKYEPLTALSFAALCMTMVNPLWLLSASFQFSFFVVLSIQLFSVSFARLASRRASGFGVPGFLANLAVLSVSAQIGSIPMQLLLYGFVPVLSLPMNMLCGMVMPLLLLGGWGVTLLSCLVFPVSVYAAQMLGCLARVFESINVTVAASRYAILRLPAPYGISILLTMGLMLLLSRRILLGSVRRRMALALSIVLALSYLPRFNPCARYVQLDVGQGDAAVVRSGRRAVLIDAGPADSYDALRYLRHEGLYVDAVVLSHPDADHAGGLGVLLTSEVNVPAIVAARGALREKVSPDVQAVLDQISRRQIPVHEVEQGMRLDTNGMSFDVLSPYGTLQGSNERSLLLYADLAGVSFLLTGDLPKDCEPAFVPDVDVLKAAHHGSADATSERLVQLASPSLALISVGEGNRYGHPSDRVLRTLAHCGVQALRTDERGCITLWLKDGSYRASCFFPPD